MDPEAAAKIVALRPAMEALLVRATSNPDGIQQPDEVDSDLMNTVRGISSKNAGRFGITAKEGEE